LARGTVNSAALYSLLAGGVFDELPNLHVVVTTLAVGGILLAGAFGDGAWIRRDAPVEKRRHVYVDTMGLSPVLIRAAVDLIGADHVLYGTDWPIYDDGPVRGRLTLALTAAGLDQDQRRQIAGGNTLRLLGIPEGYAGLRPAPALVP
jgi:aminocarboxymuconate-semialdehyde decarboxylase